MKFQAVVVRGLKILEFQAIILVQTILRQIYRITFLADYGNEYRFKITILAGACGDMYRLCSRSLQGDLFVNDSHISSR